MRTSLLVLVAALVSGCDFNVKDVLPASDSSDTASTEAPDCYIGKVRLSGLLVQERTYLSVDKKSRNKMLKASIKAKDYAQSALLRSQPDATIAELRLAIDDYKKQPVRPRLQCPGDRYIVLRQRQADLQLLQKQRVGKVIQENSELRTQIEALTQIEQELSREREIAK